MAEESMVMITLDTKNNITGLFTVSQGSLNSSIVHPREIYKRAILQNAASIIIAHNHPSGDTTPSQEDIAVTKRISEAGKLLGIELLDHIIVGDIGFCSLKERGII
jgi:DNA repair protein RadC